MEEKIINWIKEEVNKAGAKGVIIGLSGGIDSSCVAVLCKKAFPENILGIIMPCISNPKDMEDANLVAEKFNIPTKIVDLEESFKSIFNSLENKEYRKESDGGVSIANIKPRLRMITLYYFANKLNYLVAETDKKTEKMIVYLFQQQDNLINSQNNTM